MRRVPVLLTVVALLGACGGPRELSAPAPAGALQCALREAEDLGYTRMEGEPRKAYVRVSQRVEPPPELQPEEMDPMAGATAIRPATEEEASYDHLLLSQSGGRLRIQILGVLEDGEAVQASRSAENDAQRILATCSTS